MGMKEDGLPIRVVKGYAGQLRPMQTCGGKCQICQEDVWIDLPKSNGVRYSATLVVHHSCSV